MTEYSEFKLAAIQATPVYFDREASTQKACELIRKAGAEGAQIAAFSETWLPGYPFFVWGSSTEEMAAEYIANAVQIPSDTTGRLCEAAHIANIDVVIGIAERDGRTQGTVYCTLLFISNEGETILIADCSMEEIYKAKAFCNVAGHYSRPDVFQLLVNKKQRQQIEDMKVSDREFDGPGDPEEV